jgi:hypothetical protein
MPVVPPRKKRIDKFRDNHPDVKRKLSATVCQRWDMIYSPVPELSEGSFSGVFFYIKLSLTALETVARKTLTAGDNSTLLHNRNFPRYHFRNNITGRFTDQR